MKAIDNGEEWMEPMLSSVTSSPRPKTRRRNTRDQPVGLPDARPDGVARSAGADLIDPLPGGGTFVVAG